MWYAQLAPFRLILVWLFAFLLLTRLIVRALRVCGVRFSAFHYGVMGGALLVCGLFYFVGILSQEPVFYWDATFYYKMQLKLESGFLLGFREGFSYLLASVRDSEYTAFINLFTEFPFCLTDKTCASYLLSCFFNVYLPLIPIMGALFIKLAQMLAVACERLFFALCMCAAISLPLLHASLYRGQPDMFGLIFVGLILLLTIRYDFSSLDIRRLLLLVLSAFALALTRRWYILWAIAYFACYGVLVIVKAFCGDKTLRRAKLLRLLGFGFVSLAIVAVCLLPMLKRILQSDYAADYVFYRSKGLLAELLNQYRLVGLISTLVMLLGAVWGLCRPHARALVSMLLGVGGAALLLFCRIQGMETHHALILVPSYIGLLSLGVAAILSIKRKAVRAALLAALCIFFCLNLGMSVAGRAKPPLSDIQLRHQKRIDRDDILAVDYWILDHCGEGEASYMLPHGELYNPIMFRDILLPDFIMHDKLAYGSAIIGVQAFPVRLFSARYVLTCEPFSGIGMAEKYNAAFLDSPFFAERFHLVKAFPMKTGCTFYAYERTQAVDLLEVEYYRARFAEESERFPAMFDGVLDAYILEHNLS